MVKLFKDFVDKYFYADETDSGTESIAIQIKEGELTEFAETDREEIKII